MATARLRLPSPPQVRLVGRTLGEPPLGATSTVNFSEVRNGGRRESSSLFEMAQPEPRGALSDPGERRRFSTWPNLALWCTKSFVLPSRRRTQVDGRSTTTGCARSGTRHVRQNRAAGACALTAWSLFGVTPHKNCENSPPQSLTIPSVPARAWSLSSRAPWVIRHRGS